jgi:fatty-acyl-CoA synthase
VIVTGDAGDRYPWEPITIAGLLERTAAEHGPREAMVQSDRRLTWAQARDAARRVGKAFIAAGVRPGDHVAVWVPNRIEWVLLWFGAAYAGAVVVTVNTRYKVEEVRYILGQSDARMLVMVDEFVGIDYLAMLARLCPDLAAGGPPNAVELPELRSVVVLGAAPAGTMTFADFLAAGDAAVGDEQLDATAAAVDVEDPTIVLYTSGTTGRPKGAVHSHRILRNEHSIAERMEIGRESRVMNHMPFFHVAGAFTGILPPLIAGGAMLIMERWDPGAALGLIERERATVFSGIPTHFIDVLNEPSLPDRDTSTLRSGWIGGANVAPEVVDGAIERLGMKGLLPVYGMTETTSITTMARMDDAREVVLAGKGRPVSDFEVKVADPDTGEALPAGRDGEVQVRGHLVMSGYYRNPEATAAAIEPDGWFRTGDLGRLDDAGYLSITGRKSDMFIVGGSNAYPAEIEIALSEHAAVKQAYVVGVPDARLGEVGFAFVELRQAGSATEEDIVRFCQARLADYKVPRHVRFVADWPLTAAGKIERYRLGELAREASSARAASATSAAPTRTASSSGGE